MYVADGPIIPYNTGMDTGARTTIETMLSQKRASLTAIERQRAELAIEIRTLEGVLALLPNATPVSRDNVETAEQVHRIRRPNQQWADLLKMASGDASKPFGYDDLMIVAELMGIEVKEPTLRARMMDYVKSGIAHRVSNGRFLLTPEGAALVAPKDPHAADSEEAI